MLDTVTCKGHQLPSAAVRAIAQENSPFAVNGYVELIGSKRLLYDNQSIRLLFHQMLSTIIAIVSRIALELRSQIFRMNFELEARRALVR